MNNEEIIKYLIPPVATSTEPSAEYLKQKEAYDLAIKVLEQRPQGEWIPVSERLPNCNGVYNVTRIIEGTRLTDACYFDGQNTWHSDICVNHGRPYLNDIIAWIPLLEPYKKGAENDSK